MTELQLRAKLGNPVPALLGLSRWIFLVDQVRNRPSGAEKRGSLPDLWSRMRKEQMRMRRSWLY